MLNMPSDKPVVFVRFQPETRQALDEAADKDGRSLSNFLERIVVEWLNAHGRPDVQMKGPKKRTPQK